MMSLALIFTALLQAAAPAAGTPVPPAPGLTATMAPVPARPKRGTLFISPAGEAFRGVVGDPYPVVVWFAEADSDHDGKLTRAELRADALRYFAILDANHDGVIDSKEITRYEEELVPEVQVNFDGGRDYYQLPTQAYGGDGDPASGRISSDSAADAPPRIPKNMPELPRGAGRYALINAPEPVVAADADLNRRITPAEMSSAADRRFLLLDTGELGYLTLLTLPKTPIQARNESIFKKR